MLGMSTAQGCQPHLVLPVSLFIIGTFNDLPGALSSRLDGSSHFAVRMITEKRSKMRKTKIKKKDDDDDDDDKERP